MDKVSFAGTELLPPLLLATTDMCLLLSTIPDSKANASSSRQ